MSDASEYEEWETNRPMSLSFRKWLETWDPDWELMYSGEVFGLMKAFEAGIKFGNGKLLMSKCPRCGLGQDTDGEGNCFVCAKWNIERLAAFKLIEAANLYLATYADTQTHPNPSQEATVINAMRYALELTKVKEPKL